MNRRSRGLVTTALVGAMLVATPIVSASQSQASAGHHATPMGYDVLFVRHAHTTYPPPEEELSPQGIQQAATLADRLADEPIDSVTSSMMVRAFQTADDIAVDHNLPVVADSALREVDLPLKHLTPAEQYAVFIQIIQTWLAGKERDNGFGGESYDQVEARWTPWWDDFVREHRTDRGTAVVVAHGALFTLMLPATCSNKVSGEFALANLFGNTTMVRARLSPNGTLTCTEWNGVAVPSAS
jgi:broad specificity phosphatase PhoE